MPAAGPGGIEQESGDGGVVHGEEDHGIGPPEPQRQDGDDIKECDAQHGVAGPADAAVDVQADAQRDESGEQGHSGQKCHHGQPLIAVLFREDGGEGADTAFDTVHRFQATFRCSRW